MKYLIAGSIFLLIFFVYSPVVLDSKLLGYDDNVGVMPLEKVDSVSKYLEFRNSNIIIDVLPLRDFSFWLDYRVSEVLGQPVFHLTNLLFWFGCLVILFNILSLEGVSLWVASALVAYCAVHPVATNSVAWVTARKHVMACFFAMSATYFWIRALESGHRGKTVLAVTSYLLGCLSQPIIAFWPLWAWYRSKQKSWPLIVSFAISAAILFLNYRYYSSESFAALAEGNKMQGESIELFFSRILVIGRYFFQLLLPFTPSVIAYEERDFRNFAGLALLLGFLVFSFRHFRKSNYKHWALLALVPLIPVTVRPSNILGMDTYLMTSLVASAGFFAHVAEERINNKKTFFSIIAVIVMVFTFFSRGQASLWTAEEKLWEYSSRVEPGATSLIFYSNILLGKNDPQSTQKAMELTLRAREMNPNHSKLSLPLCKSIFENPYLKTEQKAELLEKNFIPHPWYVYCYGSFKAAHGNETEGNRMMQKMWDSNGAKIIPAFGNQVSAMATDWFVMCKRSKATNCIANYNALKYQTPPHLWNEETVITKLKDFKETYPPQ